MIAKGKRKNNKNHTDRQIEGKLDRQGDRKTDGRTDRYTESRVIG